KGGGRISAHSARIETLVMVEGPFVILGRREQSGVLAVTKRVQRDLGAFEKFLDDDARAGAAERATEQHFVNGPIGRHHLLAEQDSLAEGESICLHRTTASQRRRKTFGGGGVRECARPRRGNAVTFHEVLRERLGGLELSRFLVGTPD